MVIIRKFVIALMTAVFVLAASAAVYAQQPDTGASGSNMKQQQNDARINPVQMLENAKAKIKQKLSEKKITKEKADAIIARIDQKIKEIQDFDKLTLQQKKDKLVNDFTATVNKKVQDGKLARGKADTLIADFKAKIGKWDGSGYPFFGKKGLKGCGERPCRNFDGSGNKTDGLKHGRYFREDGRSDGQLKGGSQTGSNNNSL